MAGACLGPFYRHSVCMDNDLVPRRRRLAVFGATMFSLTAIVSLALFVAASGDKDPSIPSDLMPIDVVTTQPSSQPSTTGPSSQPSTTKPSTVTTIQAPPPSKAPPTTKPPRTTTPSSRLPINPPTPAGATLVEDDWGSPGSFSMIWEVSKATFSASREPVLDYVRSKGCTITEPVIGVFSCGNGVTGYASVGSREASAPDKVILDYSVNW